MNRKVKEILIFIAGILFLLAVIGVNFLIFSWMFSLGNPILVSSVLVFFSATIILLFIYLMPVSITDLPYALAIGIGWPYVIPVAGVIVIAYEYFWGKDKDVKSDYD